MEIRRARVEEGGVIADVWLRSRAAAVPAIPPAVHGDDDVRGWLAKVVGTKEDVWVAEVGGTVVAMLVLDGDWVEQLYVAPGHTGHGIGGELLELAKARRRGGLRLWTFQAIGGARRFYERHGFTAAEWTDGDNEEGAPDVRYEWRPADVEVAEVRERLAREEARGAMLIGSVARGTALDTSDLDVLVVSADDDAPSFRRQLVGPRLVETVSKPLPAWRAHLADQRPRWVWALTDGGEVLFDDGALGGLIDEATRLLDDFVSSEEVKAELATTLWHARAKLARAVSSGDPHIAAYVAALAVPDVLDSLLTLHDRPCVPGSHRMAVLATLDLDPDDRRLLAVLLAGEPLERAQAAVALNASLSARLGPPDLERTVW